jgi:hypothetical protein
MLFARIYISCTPKQTYDHIHLVRLEKNLKASFYPASHFSSGGKSLEDKCVKELAVLITVEENSVSHCSFLLVF